MATFTPSYPLTFPTTVGFTKSVLKLVRNVAITTSVFNFSQQTHQFQGEAWSFEGTLAPMKRDNAREYQAFFTQLRGRRGTFTMKDPDNTALLGNASGIIRVNGASQTGNQVALDGFGNNVTNVFKSGDYIGINSYMYFVTEDVSSNGRGEANVKIEPALRSGIEAINDNTQISYGSSAQTLWRMDANDFGWDTDRVSLYGFSFSCTEVL